jgi:hypothetical protein
MRSSRPWKLFFVALFLGVSRGGAQTTASHMDMDMGTTPNPPVTVTVDSEKHLVVVSSGPWHLPPMSMDHNVPMMMGGMGEHDANPELLLIKFPWPMKSWLRGFNLIITDKDGKVLPQRTMHHMEFMNFDRRQLVYPTIERLLGIGEETASIRLPKTVGVPLDSTQEVGVFVMWNNDTGHDLDGINLRFELIYLPNNLTPRPVAALPFKVDVNLTPGIIDAYDVPPGGSSKSVEFTVPVSGRVLGVGGHMHDHGVELRMEDASTGKVLARVHTLHDKTGAVIGVSRQLLAVKGRGVHLRAGHVYRLVSVYENKTSQPVRGVMGLMGGLFAPDDLRDWPKLDRTNKEYLRDIAVTPAPKTGRAEMMVDGVNK